MHAMKKCGGIEGMAQLILNPDTRWRRVFSFTSRPLHPLESIPTYYSKGGFWGPEPVWTLWEEKIIPWPSRESNHDYPFVKSVAQSLYRLHYPSSKAYTLGYTVLIF